MKTKGNNLTFEVLLPKMCNLTIIIGKVRQSERHLQNDRPVLVKSDRIVAGTMEMDLSQTEGDPGDTN